MSGLAIDRFIEIMNKYGADREPFLFIIDFEMKCPEIHKLNSVPQGIKFYTPSVSNVIPGQISSREVALKKYPVPFSRYSSAFENVQKNLKSGNSYLLNLTFPTQVETEFTLPELFELSVARYKLLYYNKFLVFSPEIFVRIGEGKIRSFPMKGTIDASVPDAENVLLADEKEAAEHNTIVDLIRNDISRVAEKVVVDRYRYIDRIKTAEGEILQVSSEISGNLMPGYEKCLGDIICGLLPAGSVTGAPKKETLRIINEYEGYERGWYTGIFGVFDGKSLDSGVMIRYIEKNGDRLFFKSGGGITYLSDCRKEYNELISKVYVPAG
jgi:para-aminobenzoate synthetase component 1